MPKTGHCPKETTITNQSESRRVLGLAAVTAIAVGFTIGGGVFVFTEIVYGITAQGLPIAYALAVIPVFLSMLPLAMLGSAIPTTGGNYRYPSRLVSPRLAFVGIWVYVVASFFGQIPLYAMACAQYAEALMPGIPITFIAVLIVSFFYVINLFGIELAAKIQGLLVIILLAALLYYVGSGITEFHLENVSRPLEKGTFNLMLGVGLLTFTYFGANGIIELGDEIIDPGRTIPRAFFIAFPLITIVYIAVALTTVGAVAPEVLAGLPDPLIRVCRMFCPPAGVYFFVIGGAILALTTTLNALFIVGTKSLMMIVRDEIFPSWLGRTNQRYGTAHVLLTIIWALSVVGIVSGISLETLAAYAALGGLIIFLPVQIAAIRLPKRYPERYANTKFKLKGIWFWICPGVAFLMILFFGAIILYDLKSFWKIGYFFAFIASGVLYYQMRKSHLYRKGIDLERQIREDDWNEQTG